MTPAPSNLAGIAEAMSLQEGPLVVNSKPN